MSHSTGMPNIAGRHGGGGLGDPRAAPGSFGHASGDSGMRIWTPLPHLPSIVPARHVHTRQTAACGSGKVSTISESRTPPIASPYDILCKAMLAARIRLPRRQ